VFFRDLLQPTHLIIILAIVLLIVGPGKLVGLGGALGSSIRDFKQATRDEDTDGASNKTASGNVKSIADDGEDDAPVRPAIPAYVPSSVKSVADDEDESVTVAAGTTANGVTNETGVPIKVGTTRKAYGRR